MHPKNTKGTAVPQTKLRKVVQTALPKGKQFKLHVTNSSVDNLKIVRIVTPAWKSLSPSTRIRRVLQIVNTGLTAQEMEGILRFSVLTPDEYRDLVLRSPRSKRPTPPKQLRPKTDSIDNSGAMTKE